MRHIRLQYFLTLAMLGTVLPYASVFFRHEGLNDWQVGNAFAIYGLAAVLSPALVTLLADRKGDPRRLLAALNLLTGVFLIFLCFATGVKVILAVWTLLCLALVAVFPLLNGIHFGQQQRQRDIGAAQTPFHGIRAWGTVGYIAISLLLFPPLHWGMNLRWVLMAGAGLAVLSGMQAMLLADPRRELSHHAQSAEPPRPPSFDAVRALFSPRLFAFTTAVILMSMASQIHGAFYPLYLTERAKVSEQWLGQASNVAVVVEAVLIFSCGRMIRRIGIKRLLLLCIAATTVRMALLASTTNAWVAIGSQVVHGLLVISIGVLPQALFNEHAGERFRHSMQGMLVMLTSAGQCVAVFLAGFVAGKSLPLVFASAAVLCGVAGVLVVYGFGEKGMTDDDAEELPATPLSEPEFQPPPNLIAGAI